MWAAQPPAVISAFTLFINKSRKQKENRRKIMARIWMDGFEHQQAHNYLTVRGTPGWQTGRRGYGNAQCIRWYRAGILGLNRDVYAASVLSIGSICAPGYYANRANRGA
jgi:hypothetical protein